MIFININKLIYYIFQIIFYLNKFYKIVYYLQNIYYFSNQIKKINIFYLVSFKYFDKFKTFLDFIYILIGF